MSYLTPNQKGLQKSFTPIIKEKPHALVLREKEDLAKISQPDREKRQLMTLNQLKSQKKASTSQSRNLLLEKLAPAKI